MENRAVRKGKKLPNNKLTCDDDKTSIKKECKDVMSNHNNKALGDANEDETAKYFKIKSKNKIDFYFTSDSSGCNELSMKNKESSSMISGSFQEVETSSISPQTSTMKDSCKKGSKNSMLPGLRKVTKVKPQIGKGIKRQTQSIANFFEIKVKETKIEPTVKVVEDNDDFAFFTPEQVVTMLEKIRMSLFFTTSTRHQTSVDRE